MIDRYLTGKLPTLAELPLDSGPAPLDLLWGSYYATGSYEPVLRIVSILDWSKKADNVDRLTIGSMAKWTLAQNASRDMDLLQLLKRALPHEPKATAGILREVIEAADVGEVAKIRKDALVAIETHEGQRLGEAAEPQLVGPGRADGARARLRHRQRARRSPPSAFPA